MKKAVAFVLMALLAGISACAPTQSGSVAPPPAQTSPTAQTQPQQAAPQQAQPAQPQAAPQAQPKVAVYVTGGKTQSENQALTARITHGLVNSGRYSAIERTDAFLDQVAKEMITQRSGAIDDKQISELGRQAGANFVCVADILEVFGDHQISARIINVVTVEVVASGVSAGPLKNINDFEVLSNAVVASMLGVAPSAVTVAGAATTTPVGQTASVTPPPAQSVTVPTTTSNTVTDSRDGQTYRTVKIGKLTWMAQNLNFRPRTDDTWCYGNDNSNCDKYGRLYTWDTAMSACPTGWRVPTREDWDDLVWEADGKDAAGSRLKSKTGWNRGNGTDKFGFSALPGGYRFGGSFDDVGSYGHWWSATESESVGSVFAWSRVMNFGDSEVNEGYDIKSSGFSVRCARG